MLQESLIYNSKKYKIAVTKKVYYNCVRGNKNHYEKQQKKIVNEK
jgi:hypothetical protein